MEQYDFGGWATRNDIRCSDGRTIMRDAFKDDDGTTVPLMWNHQHDKAENVLGHALLENRPDGVYAYCKFNNNPEGKRAKELVRNRDIVSLSILANNLKQTAGNVMHGAIREVSLVIAGANEGAYIDNVLAHGALNEEEATICMYYPLDMEPVLEHSDDNKKEEEKIKMNDEEEKKKKKKTDEDENLTIKDVFDAMTETQKNVVYALIGEALDNNNNDDEGDEEMKHNLFDNDDEMMANDSEVYICHADEQAEILAMAKDNRHGSWKNALKSYEDSNSLQHNAIASGFVQEGDGNITTLFPEYKNIRPGAPELITNDQSWVKAIMSKTNKVPFSRIRTQQVDIRELDLRAKGYKKGKEKQLTGNYSVARRETDPQTIYVKSALHRDDVIDMTDFDTVQYQYNVDKMSLEETLAMATLFGDSRDAGDEGYIDPSHIRPIWVDDELFTIHQDIDLNAMAQELQGTDTNTYFGKGFILAEAMIAALTNARDDYRGTGTPDLFIEQRTLNTMLLARDRNGRRIYSSVKELATELGVNEIHKVIQATGKVRTDSNGKKHNLLAIVVNMADYSYGMNKGGDVTHFTDFDIDFNQLKSLLETRKCGALTRIKSAIVIEQPVTEEKTQSVVG